MNRCLIRIHISHIKGKASLPACMLESRDELNIQLNSDDAYGNGMMLKYGNVMVLQQLQRQNEYLVLVCWHC